jgi:sulfatase maturation enzyme AslB (radical SAM superfamily)
LRLQSDNFNEEKFFENYRKLSGEIILFGGEPLLNFERVRQLLSSNRNVVTISSNMLLWNDAYKELLSNYPNIEIASSWNPFRFTEEQYKLWLKNIKDSARVTNINITLTKDLFEYDWTAFIRVLQDLDSIDCIKYISFEPLVPDYDSYAGDVFLCKCYDIFKSLRIQIDLRKIFGKKYCKGIQTLLPSGSIINDCPQWYVQNHTLLKECFDCSLIRICKPCKKICACSFPKNFYDKLKNEGLL